MNLTIEEMKSIVDGAPEWATIYDFDDQRYYTANWHVPPNCVYLSDLKKRIDQHYYGQSEGLEILRDCDIPPNTIILEK